MDDEGIKVNYDAGNVMDYTKGQVNPLDDIKTCAELIRSFCIKDHRMFPVNQDCGPGFGEIDHYRLLANVAFTGLTMPLCCENISAPKIRADNAGRDRRPGPAGAGVFGAGDSGIARVNWRAKTSLHRSSRATRWKACHSVLRTKDFGK